MTTSDLHPSIRGSNRLSLRLGALVLLLPLLLFDAAFFVIPIAQILYKSIDNPIVARVLPRMTAALKDWEGPEIPGESVFAALHEDLKTSLADRTTAAAAKRLNFSVPGFRNFLLKSANRSRRFEPSNLMAQYIALDDRWASEETWQILKRTSNRLTNDYLLAALDLKQFGDGSIGSVPKNEAIHLNVLVRTFVISATVCALCLILGFPIAVMMTSVSERLRKIMIVFVLLPFWTSLLVRSAAWVVLLQNQGVVNKVLIYLGVIDQPLELIFNRVGVIVAMVHVLLPFMVLPLYSALKTIDVNLVKAGLSLGARPTVTFRRIYLPLAAPGIVSGCLLVFILALGYYITPALVGGAGDQMLSYFIAFHTGQSLNWGMAAALAVILLVCVCVGFTMYRWLSRNTKLEVF